MNHHHLTNTCTIEHVQLPRVSVVASECPWLKQLIPSYALSVPRSSSFGRIRPSSASPGLAMELGFQRIQHSDEQLCPYEGWGYR